MNIPTSIIIKRAGVRLDGGSIDLDTRDLNDKTYCIRLSATFDDPYQNCLYLNDHPIAHHSADETALLEVIRNADIEAAPEYSAGVERLRYMLLEQIATILSMCSNNSNTAYIAKYHDNDQFIS